MMLKDEEHFKKELNTKELTDIILTTQFLSQTTVNILKKVISKDEVTLYDLISDVFAIQNSLNKEVVEEELFFFDIVKDYFIAHKIIDKDTNLDAPLLAKINILEIQNLVEYALNNMNEEEKEKLFTPVPDFETGCLFEEEEK